MRTSTSRALRLRRVDDGLAQRRIELDQGLPTHQRHIPSSEILFSSLAAYIRQFTRHGNKAGDRNGLGAPRRIDAGRCGKARGIDAERFQALPQHLAALAEGGGCDLFEQLAIAGQRLCARHQPHDGGGDLRRRHEGGRRNVEQDLRLAAPVGEHAEPAIGLLVLARDDALGDLALEHQDHHVVPGRPGLGGEPADQELGRDVVGQVGDDLCALAVEQRTRIEGHGIAMHDLEPAGIARGNLLQAPGSRARHARSR